MPDTKRPLKVFLCHAHADRDAVRALYNRLVRDGVDAWFDKEKLLPGQDWKLEIEKAVREADVVVVCLSKSFNLEGFRQREVRWALDKAMDKPDGDIFIIPARLEECDTPNSLQRWHWVDLFENNGYERLMRALMARAEKIGVIFKPTEHINSGEKPPSKVEQGEKGTGATTGVHLETGRTIKQESLQDRFDKISSHSPLSLVVDADKAPQKADWKTILMWGLRVVLYPLCIWFYFNGTILDVAWLILGIVIMEISHAIGLFLS